MSHSGINFNFLLFFIVPVQFTVLPLNVTVNETNPMSLSCDASGFPLPSIKWTKSGQNLSHKKQLNISSSDKSDAGEYMCTASNGVGQAKTAKAYVSVQCESKFHNVIKLSVAAPYHLNLAFLNYYVRLRHVNILLMCWGVEHMWNKIKHQNIKNTLILAKK